MEYNGTRREDSTNTRSLSEGGEGYNRSERCHGYHFQHADGHFQYPRHPKFRNYAESDPNSFGLKNSNETHSGI